MEFTHNDNDENDNNNDDNDKNDPDYDLDKDEGDDNEPEDNMKIETPNFNAQKYYACIDATSQPFYDKCCP